MPPVRSTGGMAIPAVVLNMLLDKEYRERQRK